MIIEVITLKGTHFTGAVAQNAAEAEDIVIAGLKDVGAKGAYYQILGVGVIGKEGKDFDLEFYHTGDMDHATDSDLDTFAGRIFIDASVDLVQIGAANLYRGLKMLDEPIHVWDKDVIDGSDTSPEIHVNYISRDAAGKLAGANGEIATHILIRSPSV